jgi:N utilization substance protein B
MEDKNLQNNLNITPVDTELDPVSNEETSCEVSIEEFLSHLNNLTRRDERIIAFYLLYIIDRFDYQLALDDAVENLKKGFGVSVTPDSFAYMLASGVLMIRDQLDEQIRPHLKNWKLERLSCCTHIILRLALWELSQPDAVVSIVINEAVELAKTFAEKDAYRFINGILDEICKTCVKEDKVSDKKIYEEPKENR